MEISTNTGNHLNRREGLMEKPKRLKYFDLHDMYNADEMDTYLAQKEKEIGELVIKEIEYFYVDCHEDGSYSCDPSCNQLIDEIKHRVQSALNKHKTINES